jgi:Baseplate J-like protein
MADTVTLDTCGCCEGVGDDAPPPHANPPGLAALAYRVRTHSGFRNAMQAALVRGRLEALTTREALDPTIGLLDAWATALDVLTFYQERIANEGYLRTATETVSIRELARTIGYELGPGAAATTDLAFELETAPGSPSAVTIEPGVKVQTLPGPGEVPQTFETVEELEAQPGWNALRARVAQVEVPAFGATEVYLQGVETNVRPGDLVLFVGNEQIDAPTLERWDVRRVEVVEPDPERGITRLHWTEGLGWQVEDKRIEPAQRDLKVYVFRQRAALFGHNAPDWRAMPNDLRSKYMDHPSGRDWPRFSLSGLRRSGEPGDTVFLDAVYPQIVAESWVLLSTPTYRELYRVLEAVEDSRTDFTLSSKTTRLRVTGDPATTEFERKLRETAVFGQSEQLPIVETPIPDPVQGDEIPLSEPAPRIAEGRTIIVSGKRARVVARRRLSLVRPGAPAIELNPGDVLDVLAPFTTSGASRRWKLRHASGAEGIVVAPGPPAQPLVAVDAPDDAETLVERVETGPPHSVDELQDALTLRAPLAHAYDRLSFRARANVVVATHGETKAEVLGNGDASQAFQRFTLKDGPLTYVPSPNAPTGGVTTLRVRVDGVLWREVRALYGLGPRDRAYTVRIDDEGKATIEFGDGEQGARLPTGSENVGVTYRVGTGLIGLAKAGQLTLLSNPPLGVKAVTNPLAAEGADESETSDRARENAPLTVLTFDRIVSLRDYEDFAAAYAGIGKAQASWLWDGERQVVHLTVAAADGSPPPPDSPALVRLRAAVRRSGEPRQAIQVDPYAPLRFEVEANVFVDPAHEPATVLRAVTDALRTAFAFERRSFGQSVAESEVVAAIQRTSGVVGVDLVALNLTGEAKAVNAVLPALGARRDGATIKAAQLLTVEPTSIKVVPTS